MKTILFYSIHDGAEQSIEVSKHITKDSNEAYEAIAAKLGISPVLVDFDPNDYSALRPTFIGLLREAVESEGVRIIRASHKI